MNEFRTCDKCPSMYDCFLAKKCPVASVPAPGSEICFSRDHAAGMAIRIEDAFKIMTSLLDGAEASTHPDDIKRKTLIIMARDRNRHLEWVAAQLRGQSQND